MKGKGRKEIKIVGRKRRTKQNKAKKKKEKFFFFKYIDENLNKRLLG